MDEDCVSAAEAAKILGVSPESITQFMNAGVLPAKAMEGNPHDIGLTQMRQIARPDLEAFAAKWNLGASAAKPT
ncbi:MAG TPA: hypothetical protein VFJ58_19675 [Armatimonadota bacterium]|nr:hypothetical protein [Armatimonadota bacterium]